jgi:hypothetical protein
MDKARIVANTLLNSLKSRMTLSKPTDQILFTRTDPIHANTYRNNRNNRNNRNKRNKKTNYQHLKYGYEPDFHHRR